MSDVLPPFLHRLRDECPELWTAYESLGRACAEAGPLDEKTRRLVKLALAVGTRSEGAVHSHARRALDVGLSADTLRHVVLLAIPTLGFPAAMAALTWIGDIAERQESA
ncbi:MAG: carboxymuconolactone decarboxylase family protein [Alphaproteobacteria bacterium]